MTAKPTIYLLRDMNGETAKTSECHSLPVTRFDGGFAPVPLPGKEKAPGSLSQLLDLEVSTGRGAEIKGEGRSYAWRCSDGALSARAPYESRTGSAFNWLRKADSTNRGVPSMVMLG